MKNRTGAERVVVKNLNAVCSFFFMAVLGGIFLAGCAKPEKADEKSQSTKRVVLRIGHFPNVTHGQGLIAHYLSTEGKGWFEERLGPDVKIEWYVYNAGPSAMEGFFTKSLDVTYVGPNPALNAHIRAKGEEVRVLAGAAQGGAALVIHKDRSIKSPQDFRGKRIATPQFGNTQDVSCRAWLAAQGFSITRTGGDVSVIPTANPDQLSLFLRGDLDGVWTVEPWVSRLEMEADGQIYLQEREALTTILACRAGFLNENPELAGKLIQAHAELTDWINANPQEAKRMATAELSRLTRREVSADLIGHAWDRIKFTSEIKGEEFQKFLTAAQSVGFLTDAQVDMKRFLEQPQ